MRWTIALLVVLALAAVFTVAYRIQFGETPPVVPSEQAHDDQELTRPSQPIPVALNRGPEVVDGFRGDVHPLLRAETRLNVTAHWTPVGKGRDQLHRVLHPALYSWYTELRPVRSEQTYTEHDFSAFLPETVGEVGQCWAIESDKMIRFLKQFHARPSMHQVASGRRAGPDGAFAMLRALSPSHLDIVFRIHAEFCLTPAVWPAHEPLVRAWYTPAYFSGRVLVNQRTGTVDFFQLGLPTDKALNVHLTAEFEDFDVYKQARDVVRVERMELTGGDSGLVERISWARALSPDAANSRLARIFYKFLEIDWTPFDQVLAQARRRGRPIFAVVSWGAFEDQSC